VAYATGVTMTGYYLGALVAPVVFGVFVDVFDRYTWSWGLSGLVLVASLPAWSAAARSHSSPSAGAIPMPAPLTRKGES
jgi:MFS family permease